MSSERVFQSLMLTILLVCVTVFAHDYYSIPAPVVKVIYIHPPAFNETVGFCIGCTATAGQQIYAGMVLPGEKPWVIKQHEYYVGRR